jgi:hypothetical protein
MSCLRGVANIRRAYAKWKKAANKKNLRLNRISNAVAGMALFGAAKQCLDCETKRHIRDMDSAGSRPQLGAGAASRLFAWTGHGTPADRATRTIARDRRPFPRAETHTAIGRDL